MLDPTRHVGVGGAAVGRIVFEPAIFWRIVRRGHDNAIGEAGFASSIMNNDRARDDWCRRHAIARLDDRFHIVGRENFQCGPLGGSG